MSGNRRGPLPRREADRAPRDGDRLLVALVSVAGAAFLAVVIRLLLQVP